MPARQLRLPPALDHLADLAGLIARSHTIDLRTAVDYLAVRHGGNKRDPRRCHAPFLMALLRIADYLQLHASRAPGQLLAIRSIRSPISRREWRIHQAVMDISSSHDDREAITVHAIPPTPGDFLRLRWILRDLQSQLDEAWAVLGEVYGPVPELHALGLTLRRVRANVLSDSDAAGLVFPTLHARFSAASPDLLKLLVKPLYGDNIGIAVRELVQNSVDAVRELRDLGSREPALVNTVPAQGSAQADVVVSLESDKAEHWLVVSDRGIGMTPQTIVDYFLRAGSSFRMSDAWKRDFLDSEGRSRVLRSGRFGIGALAAFLVGTEINVVSRHARDRRGVRFAATLDTDPIELWYADDAPIGTTIKIRIPEQVHARLTRSTSYYSTNDGFDSWDWYRLKWPAVARLNDTKRLKDDVRRLVPDSGSALSDGWFRIQVPGFEDVQWRYEPERVEPRRGQRLICNGLVISNADLKVKDFELTNPTLSVFDPEGNLPLRLDRQALAEPVPFGDELARDIVHDIIAFALATGPTKGVFSAVSASWYRAQNNHPAYKRRWHEGRDPVWFATTNGFAPLVPQVLASLACKAVLWLATDPTTARDFSLIVPAGVACVEELVHTSLSATRQWLRTVVRGTPPWLPAPTGELTLLLGSRWRREVLPTLSKRARSSFSQERDFGNIWLMSTNSKSAGLVDIGAIAKAVPDELRAEFRLAQWCPNSEASKELTKSAISTIWQECGLTTIPFQESDRGPITAGLSDRLGAHLEYWRKETRLRDQRGTRE